MRWIALVAGLAMILAGSCLEAQSGGVIGDWRDPGGSVIRIDQCGGDVCLWLISISKSAPATTDVHNPDPGERSRALCGLKIGRGFSLRDPEHATDGTLYDPKSGKTYRGTITAEGALLQLRGYVGLPLFGRSQTWTKPIQPVKVCQGARLGK